MSTPPSAGSLSWLLSDFARRMPEVTQVIAVSVDGLALAYAGMDQDDADRLAAIASGVVNLLSGAAQLIEADPVEHSLTAMEGGYLFSMAVSSGASLIVATTRDADIGEVSYMMAELINQVGDALSPQNRDAGSPFASRPL
ncbi:roadblock/LC7 domain-containing protein [Streptomyces sp. Z26]|uniref:roadblock/LC7 domain-containing protein n=1 Tax=Streptomyces TaxID=1883 RepID=UPI000EF16361|nr:roadblock/LC7 domain-containing protein [Streptomyces sp. Z26]RLL69664.1 roadblock/LC7 domain-containing protein [Streptomyces sp. Z26]